MKTTDLSVSARSHPVASVVMANFNGSAHLAEAVESAQKQTMRDLEIIVSDDGSTDDSVDIVTQLKRTDPRIRLIRSDRNGGPAAARNRAIEAAAGEWIAIMDSDDLMHHGRLATLITIGSRDGADLVADDLLEFFEQPSRPFRRLLRGQWKRAPFWVDIFDYVRLNRLYGPGPALGYLKPLIRAAVLKQNTASYDETLRIAEDYHLVLRLLRLGKTMRVYPIPLYFYRRHSGSISHRLNESALIALKAADVRFRAQFCDTEPRLATAIDSRIESIDTALAYERLLAALKAREWSNALGIALARPGAAALLRLPIGVRLRHLTPLRAEGDKNIATICGDEIDWSRDILHEFSIRFD
jgi:succinoglycan biosynthesis protein ExoO